ncbi:response regulator [Stratiformator vulcanicus]|uniref:Response regulator rcp1 n=1 Tax=Stratiformator vulcanicus TaxID=2527980 RepID=A0A517R7E7_9PLAN|nr:response regulator [Stratiformator vulcanicus]QDT39782.1 Response regulator rcp1 [Stratiformator vulcanicus]
MGRVLLVENDDGHAILFERIARKVDPNLAIDRVSSCLAVASYVQGIEASNRGKPNFVVLDWNLTGETGDVVLRYFKNLRGWHGVPVIVLSCTEDLSDRLLAYQERARGFVLKPTDYDHYTRKVSAIIRFWGCYNRSTDCGVDSSSHTFRPLAAI